MKNQNWAKIAKNLLQSELSKKGVNYLQLVELLEKIGVNETHASIMSKIPRGTFSMMFFLQCMTAIGTKTIHLNDELFDEPKTEE